MSRTIVSPARLSRQLQFQLPLHSQLRSRSRLRPRPTCLLVHKPQHPSIRSLSTSSLPLSTPRKLPWQTTLLALLTITAATYTITSTPPERNDAPPPSPASVIPVPGARGVKGTTTDNEDHPIEQVPTGTDKVPFFPRKIYLPSSPSSPSTSQSTPALPAGLGAAAETEEYVLLGLGIRKVSFLKIQVYVVGLYVAKSDLARLQESMIHAVANSESASTLVEGEKKELKSMLLDAKGSEKIWQEVLSVKEKDKGSIRSAIRVVPVRETNMGHMRDGFVRMVGAGAKREGIDEKMDTGFSEAVQSFKAIMGGASKVGKGKILLLGRGEGGALNVWAERGEKVEGRENEMLYLGGVRDERIARAVWMGYLGGANVATEGARESVVDGVLDLVERPIGTVETQVI